jgi:hypothetical protein
MQRLSTWAGWTAAILAVVFFIVKDVVAPVVVDFIKKQPETDDAIHAILKFLLNLLQHPWLHLAGWILVAFAAGLWLDWLLRRLDGSRAKQREALGIEMRLLAHDLGATNYPVMVNPMYVNRPRIVSCFTTARKFGIWMPDDRIFSIHPPRAMDLVADYLNDVGIMLRDGHFREAKQHAKSREALFDKAYADEGKRRVR